MSEEEVERDPSEELVERDPSEELVEVDPKGVLSLATSLTLSTTTPQFELEPM